MSAVTLVMLVLSYAGAGISFAILDGPWSWFGLVCLITYGNLAAREMASGGVK